MAPAHASLLLVALVVPTGTKIPNVKLHILELTSNLNWASHSDQLIDAKISQRS